MVDASLYQKNLAFFHQKFPELAVRLDSLKPQSQLVPLADGDYDIISQGVPLYGVGAKEYAKGIDDHKLWATTRLGGLEPKYMDRMAREFQQFLREQLEELGVGDETVFMSNPPCSNSYHLISLGLGLGLHLEELCEKVQCRSLIVVENNLDFIHHSLWVLDWINLSEQLDYIKIVFSPNQKQAVNEIQSYIRQVGPCFFDGIRLFVHNLKSDYVAIGNDFLAESEAITRGMGFMDDDVRMVRNSFLNLKDSDSLMWQRNKKPRHWSVMIVGSGPSLDGMIEDVRRNAPHCLVVAAGTAVPVLLRNGIIPDFCTVLENGPEQYDLFLAYAEQWPDEVHSIICLASTTVDPRLSSLFDRVIFALRDELASARLFCLKDEDLARNLSPTVTNMALSLFLASGYDDISLFGVDLGAKNAQQHHAKDSPHITGIESYDDGQPLSVQEKSPLTLKIRGNFGGTVYSDYIFNWGRMAMESLLEAYHRSGITVRNYSDGARIKGAQPSLARKFNIPPPKGDKSDAILDFLDGLEVYSPEDFSRVWNLERLVSEQQSLCDHLLSCLSDQGIYEPVTSLSSALDSAPATVGLCYLNGTLRIHLIYLHAVLNRLNPEAREKFRTASTEKLRHLIKDYTAQLVGFIDDLDQGKIKGSWLRTRTGEVSLW